MCSILFCLFVLMHADLLRWTALSMMLRLSQEGFVPLDVFMPMPRTSYICNILRLRSSYLMDLGPIPLVLVYGDSYDPLKLQCHSSSFQPQSPRLMEERRPWALNTLASVLFWDNGERWSENSHCFYQLHCPGTMEQERSLNSHSSHKPYSLRAIEEAGAHELRLLFWATPSGGNGGSAWGGPLSVRVGSVNGQAVGNAVTCAVYG